MDIPKVMHRFVDVGGVRVFYREAGDPGAPTLLLLHGFPSSSMAPLVAAFLDRIR